MAGVLWVLPDISTTGRTQILSNTPPPPPGQVNHCWCLVANGKTPTWEKDMVYFYPFPLPSFLMTAENCWYRQSAHLYKVKGWGKRSAFFPVLPYRSSSNRNILELFSFVLVLLKLHNKKAYSVGLSLSTILNQLSHLPVPYTKQLLEEDKHGLCHCCNSLIHFTKPFVDEVVQNMEALSGGDYKDLKEELLRL